MINNDENNKQDSNKHINPKIQQRLQQLLTDLQLDDAPAGGALVVYQAGKCIAQASVGMARSDLSWSSNTLSLNFSTGKGILATLTHVLVSQQMLDYDLPIAHYWPAFAAQGKAQITLRNVMSHQANVFSIQSIEVDNDTVLDWEVMLEKVAAMPTTVPENAALYDSAYSALVYGWVLGGVIEAVTDMPLAEALHHYLTHPLGIVDSCYFGVPDSKVSKVARLVKNFDVVAQEGSQESRQQSAQARPRRSKPVLRADSENTLHTYTSLPSYACWQKKAIKNQITVDKTDSEIVDEIPSLDTAQINRLYFNNSQLNLKNYKAALVLANKQPIDYYDKQTLQAIIPAANGVASAHALATIYAMLANGGVWQGQTLIDEKTFKQLSTPQVTGMDAVMPAHMDWRLGYHRRFSVCQGDGFNEAISDTNNNTENDTENDTEQAFGHMGYNGSVAWCDPARQLSFAFIHNFDVTMLNDIRQFALTEAVLALVDSEI
ncbi:serine hydrolase domain-containing protein [Psychrobacter sp. DAB_AL43B]|uniref:serine hydrolase domain-containing protein n=1 Tax=Psychrobacter sp. DAB_AL43B TaxID=1028416 RepID=UPI0009A8AFFD|nr:serine hydrolase domain-containing protein [Psychrobacter sp. DAB_AL43B]SLJ84964.1 beta-lactamase [Psychrobacter sp. DAB_AL43B]